MDGVNIPAMNIKRYFASLSQTRQLLLLLGLSAVCSVSATAQKQMPPATPVAAVLERNVRAQLGFLASDALQGRGSGTRDEFIAAHYLASQLEQFGIAPAGDTMPNGQNSFIQTVTIGAKQSFIAPPELNFTVNGTPTTWTHGKKMLAWRVSTGAINGPLQKLGANDQVKAGSIVYVTLPEARTQREYQQAIFGLVRQGAVAVLVKANADVQQNWAEMGTVLPSFTTSAPEFARSGGGPGGFNVIFLSESAVAELANVPDGTPFAFGGKLDDGEKRQTWNAVGVLAGSVPNGDAIVLSAHLDHLGVRSNSSQDKIYNGADDDASGCVAVLELARALGAGPQPKRTVYFVFFGSEEAGGYGAQAWLAHSPVPLEKIAANLEFEMIGRADKAVKPGELWLTGYERSTLGPELAKQGAALVADPHPAEQFFMRSDNYALARRGVIAHTVSSFGLHAEYHQPSDDLAHIDFTHLTQSINSLIKPVQWLANTDFKPAWLPGQKP